VKPRFFRFPFVFLASAGALLSMALLSGCLPSLVDNPITRTETDYYTITDRDTTIHETVRNTPGQNNGVVFPSSRETDIDRNTLSHDSTHDRPYPNFLRAGGLETVGLLTPTSLNGLGPGLFGVFALANSNQFLATDSGGPVYGTLYRPTDSLHPKNTNGNQFFKGEIIRVLPYEYWLRWFNDAPNWTLGWSALEIIAKDEDRSHWFTSIATNLYLRRRFILNGDIPYLIFAPYAGMSIYPSTYLNLGCELQFGSIAGLNLRAYAGWAGGFNALNSSLSDKAAFGFPYCGLGMSVLDFTNLPQETEREWKYYTHTGINVNILELSLFSTSSGDTSIWQNSSIPFNAAEVKLANVEIPLPFGNYHFWAGTSLINWMAMGFVNQGVGILPLRVGYRQYIFAEDLMFEPFLEYNYYPSSILNIGARLKLDTWTHENIGITFGYINGSPGSFSPQLFNTQGVTVSRNINTAYLGISIFLGDWNKTPETIRERHETTNDPWTPR
jgi:hypothetical protein